MLITFLGNRRYSDDAHIVQRALKGETRFVAHDTACWLMHQGWAVKTKEDL